MSLIESFSILILISFLSFLLNLLLSSFQSWINNWNWSRLQLWSCFLWNRTTPKSLDHSLVSSSRMHEFPKSPHEGIGKSTRVWREASPLCQNCGLNGSLKHSCILRVLGRDKYLVGMRAYECTADVSLDELKRCWKCGSLLDGRLPSGLPDHLT